MEKIKIIDLLKKIANGEEVPKIIKYNNHYFNYSELEKDYYEGIGYEYEFLLRNIKTEDLNDEVEIIEEDKKIEKLTFGDVDGTPRASEDDIIDKINEIIEVINENS